MAAAAFPGIPQGMGGGGGGLDPNAHSLLEVFLRGHNLPSHDLFSASDPMAVLYTRVGKKGAWNEIGRTEQVKNDPNPRWTTQFKILYEFEKDQNLLVVVYDADSKSSNLANHDLIGSMEISLAQMVCQRERGGSTPPFALKDRRGKDLPKGASISFTLEELDKENRDEIVLEFHASKLPKMDFFGRADPYLRVLKSTPGGADWVCAYETEMYRKTYKPQWRPFKLTVQDLCNGDLSRGLRIQVWDWDANSDHDLIGEFSTNLLSLLTEGEGASFTLLKAKHGRKSRGVVTLKTLKRIPRPSFLSFVSAGLKLRLSVAIDFTGSNRLPEDPSSLHHRGVNQQSGLPNPYVRAISSIGQIVTSYARNSGCKAWGFGALVISVNKVSHCFSLTQDPNAEVMGVPGILQAYWNTFSGIKLSGPTYLHEVLQTAAMASMPQQHDLREYHILLILTDGVINDFPQSVETLVNSSDLPLSVIIVGIGNADFSTMEALDSDDAMLRSKGKVAKRDIVQFVPFRDFHNYDDLAAAVLQEIPTQVEAYAALHSISPQL